MGYAQHFWLSLRAHYSEEADICCHLCSTLHRCKRPTQPGEGGLIHSQTDGHLLPGITVVAMPNDTVNAAPLASHPL